MSGAWIAAREVGEADWQSWDYDDFVRAGREVASRSAWLYGDLACAVETGYGDGTLARFAADISVNYETLLNYRTVAKAYPQSSRRRELSFGVHQAFASQSDRLELVGSREWTVAQARELIAGRRGPSPLPPPNGQPPAPQPMLDWEDDAGEDAAFPPGSEPLWGSTEARTAEVVRCTEGHIAARQTFEDVGGCPYCLHTPGERQAALNAREALLRRQREAERAQQSNPDPPPTGAHVGHNSGDHEWYTPAEYIKAAKSVMGDVDLDPASSEAANVVVAAYTFYTEADDGLSKPWSGRVWMNPPYAQPLIAQFIERLVKSYAAGDVTEACVLVNNASETRWGQEIGKAAAAICSPAGRVKFWHPSKEAVPLQGQAIHYLGPHVAEFTAEFLRFGYVKVTP